MNERKRGNFITVKPPRFNRLGFLLPESEQVVFCKKCGGELEQIVRDKSRGYWRILHRFILKCFKCGTAWKVEVHIRKNNQPYLRLIKVKSLSEIY